MRDMEYYRLQTIRLCAIGPKIGRAQVIQAILSFVFVHKFPIGVAAEYTELANERLAAFIVNWITIVHGQPQR